MTSNPMNLLRLHVVLLLAGAVLLVGANPALAQVGEIVRGAASGLFSGVWNFFAGPSEDPGQTSFETIYDFIATSPCFTCQVVNAFAVLGDFFAKTTFAMIAPELRSILVLLFLLYMFFSLMKLFTPFGEYGTGAPIKRIAVATIYFYFAYGGLTYYETFFYWIFDPVIGFGIEAGYMLFTAAVEGCNDPRMTIYTLENIEFEKYTIATPAPLAGVNMGSLQFLDQDFYLRRISCILHNTQVTAGLGIAIGVYNIFNGSSNFLVDLFTGGVLIFMFAYVLFAAGFYMLDVLYRVFIITAALPIFIIAIVLPPLRSWIMNAVNGLLQASLTFLFAAMIYGIGISIMCNIPRMFGHEGIQGIITAFDNRALNIGLLSPIFWVLLATALMMLSALKRAESLAQSFAQNGFAPVGGVGEKFSEYAARPVAAASITTKAAVAGGTLMAAKFGTKGVRALGSRMAAPGVLRDFVTSSSSGGRLARFGIKKP